MSYSCVTGTAYVGSAISFQVPWAHETSELRAVCFLLTDDDYEYAVVSSGSLTQTATGSDTTNVGATYYYACPFSSSDSTLKWGLYIWRETTTTEDDVEYDGSTIPIEDIVAKFEEHSDKGEETTLEALRSLRVPETDSNAFFPPKSVRADHVAGFDSDGNPTIGENCAEVAELYEIKQTTSDYLEECKAYAADAEESADEAAASAKAAAASATEAATYASNASSSAGSAAVSASTASSLATLAATYASEAEEYAEETEEALEEAKELVAAVQTTAENMTEVLEAAIQGTTTIVEYVSDLPSASDEDAPSVGDIAYVSSANALYVYNGNSWEYVLSLSLLVGNVETVSDLPDDASAGEIYFVTGERAYYRYSGTEWECILNAADTVFVYTPMATSLIAGVVKLSTSQTIDTTNGYGLVGFNASDQLSIPLASSSYHGVIKPGDGVTVSTTGFLSLVAATTSTLGGVLLSTDTTLDVDDDEKDYDADSDYDDQDYNTLGGSIGVDTNGQLRARTAQLKRFGVVKLGSKFQPCNSSPYCVGIGASGDDSTYGEIMFNLENNGCLVYNVTSGTGVEGTDTVYELSVLNALSSSSGFGTVQLLTAASSTYTEGTVSTAATYNYAYLDTHISELEANYETINSNYTSFASRLTSIEQTVDSINSLSLFIVMDDEDEETETFYYSNSSQTVSVQVRVVYAINTVYMSDMTISLDSDCDWISDVSSITDIYSNGSCSFTLSSNTTYDSRTATFTLSYYGQNKSFTVTQYGKSVSATASASADGDSVAVADT